MFDVKQDMNTIVAVRVIKSVAFKDPAQKQVGGVKGDAGGANAKAVAWYLEVKVFFSSPSPLSLTSLSTLSPPCYTLLASSLAILTII
jgi:hypothetical protein